MLPLKLVMSAISSLEWGPHDICFTVQRCNAPYSCSNNSSLLLQGGWKGISALQYSKARTHKVKPFLLQEKGSKNGAAKNGAKHLLHRSWRNLTSKVRHLNFAVENPDKRCLSQVMKVTLTAVISHIEIMSPHDVMRMEVYICGHLPRNA